MQNKGTEIATTKSETESKKNKNSKTGTGELPVKSPAGDHVPPVTGRSDGCGGGSDKKKKKKDGGIGSNGLSTTVAKSGPAHTGLQFQNLGQMNLSPTRQQSLLYPPETCYPPAPMVYVSAYNRGYPMGRVGDLSYFVPPSPYTCHGLDQHATYQFQSGPFVSFEIFSDENANGCSIM